MKYLRHLITGVRLCKGILAIFSNLWYPHTVRCAETLALHTEAELVEPPSGKIHS